MVKGESREQHCRRFGRAEWVDVRKGPASGDPVEVMGALKPGDALVKLPSTRSGRARDCGNRLPHGRGSVTEPRALVSGIGYGVSGISK
jgi:hypothetical protein